MTCLFDEMKQQTQTFTKTLLLLLYHTSILEILKETTQKHDCCFKNT